MLRVIPFAIITLFTVSSFFLVPSVFAHEGHVHTDEQGESKTQNTDNSVVEDVVDGEVKAAQDKVDEQKKTVEKKVQTEKDKIETKKKELENKKKELEEKAKSFNLMSFVEEKIKSILSSFFN